MALTATDLAMKGKRLWQQLKADKAGAAAAEFAMLILPMTTVMLGTYDIAYQFYLRSVVQGALNDVARTASLEAPTLNCTGTTLVEQIQCAVKKRSSVVARDATFTVTVKNFYDFSTVGRSEKLVTDYNNNGVYDVGDCFVDLNENRAFDASAGRSGVGGGDDVAFYDVTVTMPRVFPVADFMPISRNYSIRAQTALRNQPYTRQRIPPTVCV
ncbi:MULTISPECIES: TadE/TadG family type IV pilus assembly protein [unclassified Novosphingobium]|uniref:TadE/TadG family type IV pilus assembly protein n=1 Tax=unclassified Novosphingobium TaxID=2644732 RepID=UPI0025EB0E67|nr:MULTISPECIES: TadE/TadG family type IV pilus assembly protein [unclassified Novosphingobium]